MNKLLYFLPVLFALLSCSKSADNATGVDSFSQLKKTFADPPSAFRTQPFWVWNDSITREVIDEQLADFKKMGFGGVFVHPRYGLITEYLGKDWNELFAYAVEKAKKNGVEIWIYDENAYPSGFAGGLVPAGMPESYNQGQSIIIKKQDKLFLETDKKYFNIYQVRNGKYIDITNDTAKLAGKKGEYILLELGFYPRSKWYAGYSYVDLLQPGVTEKFISTTMTGYSRLFGNYPGNTIKGVFTDEPNINPMVGDAIRWTPGLFEQFSEDWDYPLETQLLSLFEETGNWKKVRHDYYSTLLKLFINRWSVPWKNYTDSAGLIWTGHYWEHGWPGMVDGPDNMAMYEYHQMPGIDMLFNTMDQSAYPEQFGNIRAVKEIASVANQLGKRRTLSETYGAAGWDLTFGDMKRLGEWEYVLGVNLLNQHLSLMSMKGDRKHDYPPSFSYHEPWWKEYKSLIDYFARLSFALSSGQQLNHVLVLEPTTTAWMYASPIKANPAVDTLRTSFHDFLKSMEHNQVEYDLGCEKILNNIGHADSGKLIVGKRSYDLVVIPPYLENLDRNTVVLLMKYLDSGGRVVSVNAQPCFVDGEPDTLISHMPERYYKQWISVPSFPEEGILHLMQSKSLIFSNPATFGGSLFHMRREYSDGQLVFLVNSSANDQAIGTFTASGASVYKMNLFSGRISAFPCIASEGQVRVSFMLQPGNSLLLFIAQNGKAKKTVSTGREYQLVEATGECSVKPEQDNVLTLDYCRLSMKDCPDTTAYFYDAGNMIWSHYGFADNPWVSSSQFKTELVDRDTFSTGTGFILQYFFNIEEKIPLSEIKVVAERSHIFKLAVNGKSLLPEPGKWWLDKSFAVYKIGSYARIGENYITLTVSPMSIFAEVEPVYLVGDFGVKTSEKGFCIVKAPTMKVGSWKKQDYPFYAGLVEYSRSFNLDHTPASGKICLNNWFGTLAAVDVNGKRVGQIIEKPYELDVTGYLQKGKNDVIVTVFGSLKNLLGPFHYSGQRGIVTPWSFKYAPEVQPAGSMYDQLDYGLFDEFDLKVSY